jgi:hypothetical protein
MTRVAVPVVLALLALLASISLVMHDSFYSAMKVRPEDAGISDFDIVVRGVVYLGLPVAAAAVAATGVLLWAGAVAFGTRGRQWAAAVLAVVVAGGAAAIVAAVMAPGALDFATGSFLRLVGALIVLLGFATVLALLIGFMRRGTGPNLFLGWLALAIMTLAAVPALLLARSAGEALARDARSGLLLQPGALDPLQVRAQPACVLPRTPAETIAPVKNFVLLGESTAGALLYDPDYRRAFTIPAERIGVLGVVNETCREPGEPVPVETGTPAEDAALARRFRPILRFDSREPWRPLNVERFVAETFPDPPTRHLVCPERGDCRAIGSTADLTDAAARLELRGSRSDGSDQRAPPSCPRSSPVLDCLNDASAIYYRVTRQDRRVFIDYWWFLRYNHFPLPVGPGGPCGGRPTPKSQHEGDWEGVTVVTKFGRPRELDYVIFSAHGHPFRYRGLQSEPQGRRPVVYVACGSHAGYPRPCASRRGCRQTKACRPNPCRDPLSLLAEAPSDGKSPWHRNSDAACFTTTPCLLPFPADERTAAPTGWTAWQGRWGNKRGPRSPARQGHFIDPWDAILTDRADFDRKAAGKAPSSSG